MPFDEDGGPPYRTLHAEGPRTYAAWQDITWAIDNLKAQMQLDQYKPERVLALGKGAMIPARLLAEEGVRVYYVGLSSYKGTEQAELKFYQVVGWEEERELHLPGTLIVDDLWDTGQTFTWARQWLPGAKTAALYSKGTDHTLDYVHKQLEGKPWIVFPWE